ncbi:ATP-binding protein [uncultured Arcticibacterium sp.]|uniref:tetratricopeptide repeat-containing sensor histidine kinase n=1 Tax=uncultured Arcticibacterium sp. TaxID=2173042 RepID=UPI0030F9B68C
MSRSSKILLPFVFFIGFFWQLNVVAQDQYPDWTLLFTKVQLDSLLQKYETEKDTLGLAYTYWSYAKYEEHSNIPDISPMATLHKSMEFFLVVGDSVNYYNIRGAIGSYYMDRVYIKKFAKEYIESSVNYFRINDWPSLEIGHLVNLANIDIHENKFENVLDRLERAEMLDKEVDDEAFTGRIHSAYADYYTRIRDFEKSLEHAEKSRVIGEKLKIGWLEALAYYLKAASYREMGFQEKRIEALLKSLEIIESNEILYQLKKEVYDNIRDYYFYKKDYQNAYKYANITLRTVEKIYTSKIESDLRSFSDYNLIEKQRITVAKLALEKKLAENEIERLETRQQMYVGVLFLTLLILVLLVIAFVNRRAINQLEINHANKNNQINTLNALIEGQEKERERIAQELHDGLGTMLSRIKILMGRGLTQSNTVQMLDDACTELRNISSNMQPSNLTNFGLVKALQDFVLKQNSNEPSIIFEHFGEAHDLGKNKNLMIYRITQELLTNSLKYAKAKEILVQIIFSDETVNLTVEDDGIGFDETKIKEGSSGWNNIRSRVDYLKGMLNLHSDRETGTSITISIPLA